jgi:hypothetical protein
MLKFEPKPWAMIPWLRQFFVRERQAPGNDVTLKAYAFNYAGDYTVNHAPTSRMVIDMGHPWDASFCIDVG